MIDVVIIGGGPAGYVCAIKLAQYGKKVLLVEKKYLGGTCTNVGCIPTKSLLQSAHYYYEIKEKGKKFGIKYENLDFDFNSVKRQMNKSVTLSRKGIEFLLNKYGVILKNGEAKIIDKNKIKIIKNDGDSEEIDCSYIVCAQGSKPSIPKLFENIPGLLTSDNIFEMESFPQSIAIVGGGVIGVEFATFFSSFGIKVYLIELMPHILPFEDEDAASIIKNSLKSNKVEVFENYKVEEIKFEKENNYSIKLKSNSEEKEIKTEKVLIATGRIPNITEDIINAGIKVEKGIITNEYLQTNIENIYAIGDIRAKVMLAHVALYEGVIAALNICGKKEKADLKYYPSIIFSNPEIGSTGLKESEIEKLENKDEFSIAKFPVSANGRARTLDEKDGFAKIIYNKKTKLIYGGTIVSPFATELIMQLILACKNNIKLDELSLTIFPHPTLSETIHETFEIAEGFPTHI